MNEITESQIRKSRITFILLLLVFVLPILVAGIFSQHPEWLPGKKNHGEFVRPMRDVPDFILQDGHGSPFTKIQFEKKWSIVYLRNSTCDTNCTHALYNIRQSRLAQAANVDKVQYIYLATGVMPDAKIITDHPDMIVIKGAPDEQNKLLAVFQESKTQQSTTSASIYLVDPDKRVMMTYAEDFAPKGMIKDLELILKVR